MTFLTPPALWEPRHLSSPAPWAGHIPFAFWLTSVMRPRTLVELGAYSGISYLAFCQAIRQLELPTQAFAIDTWEGDVHAGAYGETIYQTLRQAHDAPYSGFSTLLRMLFDDALPLFANGSVDLLHIDGLHTYEAVRHDFETWLPKMSETGVVLFHDSNVYRDDFGVHQLWRELAPRYPSCHFKHSNGLGVLLIGAQQPQELLELCQPDAQGHAQLLFSSLGGRFEHRAEILNLQTVVRDVSESEARERQAGEQRHRWIEQQDRRILELQGELTRQQALAHAELAKQEALAHAELAKQKALAHTQAANLQSMLDDGHEKLVATVQQLEMITAKWTEASGELDRARRTISEIYASRSWRMTSSLRRAGQLARDWGVVSFLKRSRNVLRYLARGDIRGLATRAQNIRNENARSQQARNVASARTVGVMATQHTLFVAHILARALEEAGLEVAISTESPQKFDLDLYIVVCPQMFNRLPPGEKRIAFQMEQSVSSRWFTAEYLAVLESSLAVFDYAQTNLAFLEQKGISYPHTFLVPIGGFPGYGEYLQAATAASELVLPDSTYDVLFYGDINAPRRQEMLAALRSRFDVRVEGNLFGPALHRALAGARVVVNIHYYEGALLETTRIYECLSLGIPVVSETSVDMAEHEHLASAVRFVPIGDTNALADAVQDALDSVQTSGAEALPEVMIKSDRHFRFMLFRALYALRMISHAQWMALTAQTPLPGNTLALSLPETPKRRNAFLQVRPPAVEVFDGLRYSPGWVGCALSYKYLAQRALDAHWPRLEVMEDDVLFPHDYAERKAVVDAYLVEREGHWDVFVGLIALLHPDTQVLNVERRDGVTFVMVDRMISMVHNVYARSALRLLSTWDETNRDADVNTIDRHLQSSRQLRVVTTLPFLVGHHEDLHSSLWGVQNTQYRDLIATAQADLEVKVLAFEMGASARPGH